MTIEAEITERLDQLRATLGLPTSSSATIIHVGLTVDVLGDRYLARSADLSPEVQEAWWQRTDYGWTCTACPDSAGVGYKTQRGARKSADKHASEHPGAVVQEVGE